MFFELRQYRILPGKRDEWVTVMEERIILGQTAMGAQEDDLYVWIRRFESEEQFTAFSSAYCGSEEWKNELQPKAKEMIASTAITRIEATPKSVIR
jgi:hypothetical protein